MKHDVRSRGVRQLPNSFFLTRQKISEHPINLLVYILDNVIKKTSDAGVNATKANADAPKMRDQHSPSPLATLIAFVTDGSYSTFYYLLRPREKQS